MNLNLQRRDKVALAAAALTLLVFLFFQLVVFPMLDARERAGKQLRVKAETLAKMESLAAQLRQLREKGRYSGGIIKKRPRDFTLFSFLEKLAGQTGVKDHIVYMKPSTKNLKNSTYKLSLVELKLRGITMEQLVGFLYQVETSYNLIWIKRMSIIASDKQQGTISAVIQAETYRA